MRCWRGGGIRGVGGDSGVGEAVGDGVVISSKGMRWVLGGTCTLGGEVAGVGLGFGTLGCEAAVTGDLIGVAACGGGEVAAVNMSLIR